MCFSGVFPILKTDDKKPKHMNQKPHTHRRIVHVLGWYSAAVLLTVGLLSHPLQQIFAQTVQDLRSEASTLQEEIRETNREAERLDEQATSLEEAIEKLDEQIEDSEKRIKTLTKRVDALQADLDEAQAELDRQKALLRANMRALYKRSDVTTFELMASSDSFSEYIDEQEYLERLKYSIQESTEVVLDIRLEIQAQRDEQSSLLDQQESVKQSLADTKEERQVLLDETKDEEKRLREYSQGLMERQREINQELLRMSRVERVGGSGGYPWAEAQCAYTDISNGPCRHPTNSLGDYEWYVDGNKDDRRDPWGYYYRNCTSYVAWKSAQFGFELDLDGPDRRSLGDGGSWADNASRYDGLSTGTQARPGSFAVFQIGNFGHVAFVEKVRGNEILVSEYNLVADGVYSERWVSVHQPTSYVYTPFTQ